MKIKVTALMFIALLALPAHRSRIAGKVPQMANNIMVVSDSQLAAKVGKEIFLQGGNVIDAVVATAFAMAVTFPAAGNIGGGGFLVYHNAKGTTTTIDFREKAPAASAPAMYLDANGKYKKDQGHAGFLSVGVPGTVAGLYLAHSKYGKMAWSKLLEPAIRLAEEGFPFPYSMHLDSKYFKDQWSQLPSTAHVMLKAGKDIFQPGEVWKQPDLANTLKRIKEKGRDGFYKGETAQRLAQFFQQNKGLISTADLAQYDAVERKPVVGTYRNHTIYSMPPPSSGGVTLIEMLNILEGYDLQAMGFNSADYVHVLTEAMRRAYANRAEFLGDPSFNPSMPLDNLMSKEYAKNLRGKISNDKASVSDSSHFAHPYEGTHTTHISVMDIEGNAVALTYTVEQGYGSQIVADGLGFFLNNEMGDFNLVPNVTNSQGDIGTVPNRISPGKRMLSSMTPTIVEKDGRAVMVVGAQGGRTIITTVLQVLLNVIDHKMNIGEAIEAGRIHHQWLPDKIECERFVLSADVQQVLKQRGHKVSEAREIQYQGSATGIQFNQQLHALMGAADTRSVDGGAEGN